MSLGGIPEDRIVNVTDQLESVDDVPDLNTGDPGFMEALLKSKKEAPSKFESYWEKDENDIDGWSDVNIHL